MKTKLMYLVAVLLLLASCGGYNQPDYSIAEFTYENIHPLKVVFFNTSRNANRYTWDFGDGVTSHEKNPTHKYAKKGVYKVKLYAEGYGTVSDTEIQDITVEEPTKCYITGVVYENVPVYNEYYNLRCTDDYILFETLYWNTDWSLLSSANLPFEDNFSKKQQVDFSKSEYVLRLYQNSKTSGKGTQVEKWNISPSQLKAGFNEQIKKSSAKASLTLNLEWKD